jgi:hypothetical protein
VSEDRAPQEYDAGLERITSGIVDALSAIGIRIARTDITYEPAWVPGSRDAPESIRVVISPNAAPGAKLDFSREQIEDCWERLDREDVHRTIRNLVAEYKRVLAEG